jgi:hypothetical protein
MIKLFRNTASRVTAATIRHFHYIPNNLGSVFTRYAGAVEIIPDSSDPRCTEIYQLRYNVMNRQSRSPSLFTATHPQVYLGTDHEYEIRDELDEDPATVHFALRNPTTGRLVAAIRIVDANQSVLDMERYGWFDIPAEIKSAGAAELGRLVADRSIRKTNAALLLYIQSGYHLQDQGIENLLFMVDSRAQRLVDTYRRLTICDPLTDEPVRCDEFEVGRTSHIMRIPLGAPGTRERARFIAQVDGPVNCLSMILPSYDTVR